MKKIILLLIFLAIFLPAQFLCAQNFKGKPPKRISIAQPLKRLNVGEVLTYSVEWLGIPSGKIILEVSEITYVDGKECYHIIARAKPNKFFARFYDIEYIVHSYLDTVTLIPYRFEKIRRVKNTKSVLVIDFDRKNSLARMHQEGADCGYFIESSLRGEISVNGPASTDQIYPTTQDLLSSLFSFRLLSIVANESYPFHIYYDNKNWPCSFKVKEPFARDMRKKGVLEVFDAVPSSELTGFILGKRKIYIQFSAGSSRVPVEFGFNTSIGTIRGHIQDLP